MSQAPDSEVMIGLAGSHGVVVAPAVVLGNARARFRRRRIVSGHVDVERQRFDAAVAQVEDELRGKIANLSGRIEASILEAYLLMVGDEVLADEVGKQIDDERRCADWAVWAATQALASKLGAVDDPYMRERSHDIEFVGELLLRALGGGDAVGILFDVTEPSIIVAHDLSPADTASMIGKPVVGFVTEVGSRTSHTAIMARALEIPAVVGLKDALSRIGTGDLLVLDGLRGRVIVAPSVDEVDDAERRASRYDAWARELNRKRDEPARTTDGVGMALRANIELPEEAAIARDHGAEGVGLYRTEFLYVNRRSPPSEDEQLDIFRRVLDVMGDRPVTLRTFDIGGDKFTTTFRMPDELNPMLGLRAVRLALAEPNVFLVHLRAMVRASAFGNVRVMIPLVSTVDELRAVRELLARAEDEVRAAGQPCADRIPLGVMIEVPAAAVMAHRFAEEADFMSIGTNDLVQYALAVDRTNRSLAHLASPFDPAILRLIHGVVVAGRAHDCPVSVCGEMASEPYGALMLLGLGVRELSMESVAVPEVKEAVGRVQLAEIERLAEIALEMATAAEVEELLADALEPRLHDIITGQPDSVPGGRGSSRPRAARPSSGRRGPASSGRRPPERSWLDDTGEGDA